MPLDPSIALAYRPPQVNVDVPNPIQQFGQILSLRNMMQQGQAGQLELQTKMLQLQQIRQAVEERKNLADLFQNPQTQTPSPAAPPPVASAPAGTPALAAPQYTPVAPYTPLAPPAVTPNTPRAAAPAAGPALGAATVTDPFANLPSYSDILRAAPTTGAAHIETISKARKAYWENVDQQHKAQLDSINDMATIASTVHDEPTKFAAIAEAFRRKLITPEVRDQLSNHPYNKQEWDGFNTQALDAAKRGEEARAQINQKITEEKDAFDKSMRPYQLTEAQAKATEAGAKAKTATYGSVAQDAALPKSQAEWDTFLAGVPDPVLRSKLPATYSPAAQQQTVSILGQTPEQQLTSTETARHNQRIEELTGQGHTQQQATALANIEGKLRDDFNQATKTFPTIRDAYGRIQAAKSAPPSGASDIALLYGYMKVLDPGSTVREGEFKTASEAGGVPDWIATWRNRILNGERLSPNVRNEMMDNVEKLYGRAAEDYQKTSQQFTDISKRSGADPRNVVIDYTTTAKKSPQTVTSEVQKALSGAERGKIHQLSDGSVWLVNADGSIQPATAPKQ